MRGIARLSAAALVVYGLYYLGHGWLPVPTAVGRVVYYTVASGPLTLYPLDLALIALASAAPSAAAGLGALEALGPAVLAGLGYALLYSAGIPWGPSLMGLAALLGLAAHSRILGSRGLLEAAGLGVLAVEAPAAGAALSYYALGRWAGPAWGVVLRERILWAVPGWASLTLLPIAGLAALPGLLLGRWAWLERLRAPLRSPPREARGGSRGSGGWCLAASAGVAALVVVLPHLPTVDPGLRPVSVDTFYYLGFIRDASTHGLRVALADYSGMARPAYLALLYLASRRVDPVLLVDVVHPIAAGAGLAAASYYLARRLYGPGAACTAALLAAAGRGLATFVAGGFQANSAALPLALLMLATPPEGAPRLAVLAVLVGLVHPWTLAFYTAAYPLAWLRVLSRSRGRIPGVAAALALAWLASEAVGRLGSSSPAGAVGSVAAHSLAAPGGLVGLYRAATLWTWGTQYNPPLLLLAAASPPSAAWAPLALAGPLALLTPAVIAHRLLLEAPLEAMAAPTLQGLPGTLKAALALAIATATLEALTALTPLQSLPGPPGATG